MTGLISRGVGIPVVASGGAGTPDHILAVFRDAAADAALVASMVHSGTWSIAGIKGWRPAAFRFAQPERECTGRGCIGPGSQLPENGFPAIF